MAINFSTDPFCSSSRGRLVPAERCPGHAAALLPHDGIEPQPHLIAPFGCDQQHATLPLHGVAQERLTGAQCGRQIEYHERLAGRPTAR